MRILGQNATGDQIGPFYDFGIIFNKQKTNKNLKFQFALFIETKKTVPDKQNFSFHKFFVLGHISKLTLKMRMIEIITEKLFLFSENFKICTFYTKKIMKNE